MLIGDWSAESGWRLGTLLARMEEVTAIFAASDDMAFGILRALVDRGRRVPEDVSVVGTDDVPLAAFAPVALTTVRQPFQDLGTAAIDLLVDMVERPDREHHGVLMEPELVLRSSTAPCHAG
ncbi:transcriptional regulator [Cutibacterium acnes JCM 18920]|nr:transcriptional regulator [Cutibacterium acnes JCM 18920]